MKALFIELHCGGAKQTLGCVVFMKVLLRKNAFDGQCHDYSHMSFSHNYSLPVIPRLFLSDSKVFFIILRMETVTDSDLPSLVDLKRFKVSSMPNPSILVHFHRSQCRYRYTFSLQLF